MLKKFKISDLKWPDLFAIILAFLMPLFPKLIPVLLVFLFLSLLTDFKKIKLHKEFKLMAWLYSLTYLFYVFGMLNSSHIQDGLFTLEVKLSFLVIPLFFLFHGPFHVNVLRKILFSFVIGCFINSLLCLYKGYTCYLETGWWECFFTSFLSFGFHTTYLSVYYCLSILFIIYFLINYYSRLKIVMVIILLFLIVYFSGFVLLLSSKGGLVALLTVLAVAFFYFTTDMVQTRVSLAFKAFQLTKNELFEKHRHSTESTEVRLMIWHVAGREIQKHPLGVGTGDAKYVLLEKYKELGMTGAYKAKLNCHNQFYETALAIGIHGLLVLVIFLVYLLGSAIKKRNFILLWIVVIVMLNLFFESMFETQAGVVFFVFFTGLLLTSVPDVIPLQQDEKD